MRDYYSVQALHNLLSWPVTSRFTDHFCTVSGLPPRGSGQHYSGSPIYPGTVCNLFLPCPLPACAYDLNPITFSRELRRHRHLSTNAAAVA